MKKLSVFKLVILLFSFSLFLLSCSQENEIIEENQLVSSSFLEKCDCPPPFPGGGGSNDDSNDHVFSSYDYFGDITVSGYSSNVYHITNKSLVKFSYGINLNSNGQISGTIIGNISPKTDVSVLSYSYDNNNAYFTLKVKGKVSEYDGMGVPTVNYSLWAHLYGLDDDGLATTYFNVNLTIPFVQMPSLTGGGSGESGVFPYDQ